MDVREILVPGRSMALAGHGMDGKSLMLIELTAAALSRSGRDEQPKVLVIASHQLVRCFKAELGVVEGDIEFINPEALEANQVSQSKDCETTFALLERIARLHRPNLVVLQSIESLIATPQTTRRTCDAGTHIVPHDRTGDPTEWRRRTRRGRFRKDDRGRVIEG
jgi:hypothetical protein